jgi:hypothetical protein
MKALMFMNGSAAFVANCVEPSTYAKSMAVMIYDTVSHKFEKDRFGLALNEPALSTPELDEFIKVNMSMAKYFRELAKD